MPEPNSSLSARDIRTVLFPPYDTSLARGLALFTHPPPSAEQRGTGVASGDLHLPRQEPHAGWLWWRLTEAHVHSVPFLLPLRIANGDTALPPSPSLDHSYVCVLCVIWGVHRS